MSHFDELFDLSESDHRTLTALLDSGELTESEREAFEDMLELDGGLTPKQRAWVEDVCERIGVCGAKNLWSQGKVPRGREVPTPEVLRTLPKKPPRSR